MNFLATFSCGNFTLFKPLVLTQATTFISRGGILTLPGAQPAVAGTAGLFFTSLKLNLYDCVIGVKVIWLALLKLVLCYRDDWLWNGKSSCTSANLQLGSRQ